MVDEMLEGLRMVSDHPLLRALAGSSATISFFGNFIGALYTLYAVNELGLSPVWLGVTIGVGGIGELAGALLAGRFVRRFGLGRTMIGSVLAFSLLALLIPLARGPVIVATAFLMASQLLQDVAFAVYSINELSLRQLAAPPEMLGRANSVNHVIVVGVGSLGSLIGGVLALWAGMRPTLGLACLGMGLAAVWLWKSPVRQGWTPAPGSLRPPET
jgi:predicted MFS family arabinose efflux permease